MTENRSYGSSPTSLGVAAKRAVAALREKAIDPEPLLARAGLRAADLDDRATRVSASAEARLIEDAAHSLGDPTFGLHLATQGSSDQWGLVYFLLRAAPTIREAFRLLPRYAPLLNESTRWTTACQPTKFCVADLRYSGLLRRDLRHATEYHIAAVLQHLRDFAGQNFPPERVTFAHVRTAEIKRFERFFRCPVEFGAEADRVVLSKEMLDLPSRRADPYLFQALQPFADGEANARGAPVSSLSESVQNALFLTLARGEPTAESIARALALSPRTLSRRLADEGVTFADLLASLRQSLAGEYVKESGLAMEQIALLLGYKEVASFSHAFRRWTGVAPSCARRTQSAGGPAV